MLAVMLFASDCTHDESQVPIPVIDDSWKTAHDLNGDGESDTISTAYTGGAHCCYQLTVTLTGCAEPLALPFELDGGYVFGLDLSQPGRFSILDPDSDGTQSLLVETHTYNSERFEVPEEMQAQGVTTNRVLAHFDGCAVRYEGLPYSIRPAVAQALDPSGVVDGTFVDGVALSEQGERWFIIDRHGVLLAELPGRPEDAHFEDGQLRMYDRYYDGMGIVGTDGQWILPPEFDYIKPFSEGLAAAASKGPGDWGYIDRAGEWAVAPRFSYATPFEDGVAEVWLDGPQQLDRKTLSLRPILH